MKYAKAFGIITVSTILLCSVLLALAPASKDYIWVEDGVIESVSAYLFFVAFVIAGSLLVRAWKTPQRKFLIVLTLLGLVGFLDEISFGARYFHWRVPAIYGHKFDGVHDVVDFIYKSFELNWSMHTPTICFILGAFSLYWVIWAAAYRKEIAARYRSALTRESGVLLMLFGILLITAMILDFDIIVAEFAIMLEEVLEMSCALAFVLGCWCLRNEIKQT